MRLFYFASPENARENGITGHPQRWHPSPRGRGAGEGGSESVQGYGFPHPSPLPVGEGGFTWRLPLIGGAATLCYSTGAMTERQEMPWQAVVLVGHGGIPTDCPRPLVTRLKALEAQRRASGKPPSPEERELEARIRRWPRTPQTDPYQAGLEALAAHLRPLLDGVTLTIAYNEFCTPTLEEAVEDLMAAGITSIAVVPSMLTPGGVHSEVEIPEILTHLRRRHPHLDLRYIWPIDLTRVARLLVDQLKRFQ
jgi:sirohydrochlorin cobaltochelatase